jgi:hypothetical protein
MINKKDVFILMVVIGIILLGYYFKIIPSFKLLLVVFFSTFLGSFVAEKIAKKYKKK